MLSYVHDNEEIEQFIVEHEDEFDGVVKTTPKQQPVDFAFLDVEKRPIGVERKEVRDLWKSLDDGRIEDNLALAATVYAEVILLVEGVYTADSNGELVVLESDMCGFSIRKKLDFGERIVQYAHVQALIDRIGSYGFHVRHTSSPVDTARTLVAIYRSRNVPVEKRGLFQRIVPRLPYRNVDTKVETLVRLFKGDGIGEVMAKALIKRFGSLSGIVLAKESEVAKVVGKAKAQVVKRRLQ